MSHMHLTIEGREVIAEIKFAGYSQAEIAAKIAGQLPILYRNDKRMRVSIESICVWIRGNKSIGGTMHKCLRQSSKKRRKRYGTGGTRGQIANRKSIDQRPASANNRSRYGHWESDTVEGKKEAVIW